MSLTEKPINQDNAVVDGTQSEGDSLRISMENLREMTMVIKSKIRWMILMLVKI